MVDDLGYNDLAINNDNDAIDTPNLDQLARDGVRFTRHYASAVCSPARAALLTGQYSERLGYMPNGRGISSEITTLPEVLQDHGYATWHIGKWHIGDLEEEAKPDHQGFDHWFGFFRQSWLAGKHENGELVMDRPRYEEPWLEGSDSPGRHYPGHLENILTEKALEVLTELEGDEPPWFVNLWFYAPHAPISPAAEFASQYPDTAEGRYRALVKQLDTNIGRIMSHLEEIGALENTIVVLVSDNGGTNREIDNNAPFFGTKASLQEGGIRTPMIIRWARGGHRGQVIDDPVSIRDIYPTLLASLNIEPPVELDGRNLEPLLSGQQALPGRSLFWEHGSAYSVRSRNSEWRLLRPLFSYSLSIFDLLQDPTVSNPVVPLPQPVTSELQADYASWYRDVHRVKTRYTVDKNGQGSLTGMDMQRSPGFERYTFGMAISDQDSGQLALQLDSWGISRSGNTVTARFGDHYLSGEIDSDSSCHSIVVVGSFYRQLVWFTEEENISLSLYLDGELTEAIQADGVFEVDDLSAAIEVGDPDLVSIDGSLPSPVVLNIAADQSPVWTVESFSQELCQRL